MRIAFTLLLLVPSLVATALAQTPYDGDPEAGQAIFDLNCAVCHGMDGAGDGIMASVLSVTPPDLTQLGAEDGHFPSDTLVRKIDGRNILSHGGPMPVFGNIFEGDSAVVDGPGGDPVFTTKPVIDVVSYLESLQAAD